MMEDIYQKRGYKNRLDYLMNLSEEYGVPYDAVYTAAYLLGPSEDFDGLVTVLKEWEE